MVDRSGLPGEQEVRNADQNAALRQSIDAVNEKIRDVMGRMPAHSVNPSIMNELFSLEDEKSQLEKRLKALRDGR